MPHAARFLQSAPSFPILLCCWGVGMWPHFHHSGGPSPASEVEQERGSTYVKSVSQNCGECPWLAAWTGHGLLVNGWSQALLLNLPHPHPGWLSCLHLCELPRLLAPVIQDWVLVAYRLTVLTGTAARRDWSSGGEEQAQVSSGRARKSFQAASSEHGACPFRGTSEELWEILLTGHLRVPCFCHKPQ